MLLLSPAYDNKITRKYSAPTIEHKVENKLALQERVGWIEEPKQPVIFLPTAMTDALGGQLLLDLLPGILELSVGLVVRGRGSKKYGEALTKFAKQHSHKIAILPDDELSARQMYAGGDIALFLADHDEDGELQNALSYGAIPVSLPQSILANYNPVQESGNAFVFEHASVWQCFASIVRALETFKFPYDWRTIQRHAMSTVEKSHAVASA